MRLVHWFGKTTIAAILMALSASAISAQGTDLLTFSGPVHREVNIYIRNGRAWVSNVGRDEPGGGRLRVVGRVPTEPSTVGVALMEGSGTADVIQQPSAANGYTTIIRVRNSEDTGNYRLRAFYNMESGGEVVGAAPAGSLHWTGMVDGDVDLRIRGSRIRTVVLGGHDVRNATAIFGSGGLPVGASNVSVGVTQGRGSVSVIQQPTAANGYTAVVHISDPQPGAGFYDLNLSWY